jgi:hypothetical protein
MPGPAAGPLALHYIGARGRVPSHDARMASRPASFSRIYRHCEAKARIGVIVAAFSYGGERPGNISVVLARSWLLTRQTSRKCGSDYPSTVAAAMTAQVNGGTSIAHHVSIMHMMLLVQFLFSPIDPGLTLGGVI